MNHPSGETNEKSVIRAEKRRLIKMRSVADEKWRRGRSDSDDKSCALIGPTPVVPQFTRPRVFSNRSKEERRRETDELIRFFRSDMTIPNSESTDGQRWTHLRRILERTGPFKDPNFEPSTEVNGELQHLASFLVDIFLPILSAIGSVKLLIIGAGGLGCELLKDLVRNERTNVDRSSGWIFRR